MKIYIGNMSYETTEDDLRHAFEAFGEVVSVNIITDRDSGRPKGFGFVEMATEEGAQKAKETLHEKELDGRNIIVDEARPMEKKSFQPRGGFDQPEL